MLGVGGGGGKSEGGGGAWKEWADGLYVNEVKEKNGKGEYPAKNNWEMRMANKRCRMMAGGRKGEVEMEGWRGWGGDAVTCSM